MEPMKATSVNSRAEELFVQLFCEAFGPEKTENLQVQYPCVDIYGRHRYIDFALESPEAKIAIEIDGETYHNPSKVSENKYADDLLKQTCRFRWGRPSSFGTTSRKPPRTCRRCERMARPLRCCTMQPA